MALKSFKTLGPGLIFAGEARQARQCRRAHEPTLEGRSWKALRSVWLPTLLTNISPGWNKLARDKCCSLFGLVLANVDFFFDPRLSVPAKRISSTRRSTRAASLAKMPNICGSFQGTLKGEESLYCWPPVWLVWNQLLDKWQFMFLFAKQTHPNQWNGRSTVQWCFPL